MDATDSAATSPDVRPVRHSRMAFAAVAFSIFAFIPPFGITAVVLGHLSSRRIAASRGLLNGKATAQAAMIIGYVQMFLLAVATVLIWQALHLTVQDFRHDALVQRVLRETDARQTLDSTSARQQEIAAQALVIEMVAIEDQYHRQNQQGYLCSIDGLLQTGVEGATPAEKRALYERLQASAYMFEVRGCTATDTDSDTPAAGYKLTAVPRSPRMPDGSLIFCADETGTVEQIRSATSIDCFDRGYVILKPASQTSP